MHSPSVSSSVRYAGKHIPPSDVANSTCWIGMADFWKPLSHKRRLFKYFSEEERSDIRGFRATLNLPFREVVEPQTTGRSKSYAEGTAQNMEYAENMVCTNSTRVSDDTKLLHVNNFGRHLLNEYMLKTTMQWQKPGLIGMMHRYRFMRKRPGWVDTTISYHRWNFIYKVECRTTIRAASFCYRKAVPDRRYSLRTSSHIPKVWPHDGQPIKTTGIYAITAGK